MVEAPKVSSLATPNLPSATSDVKIPPSAPSSSLLSSCPHSCLPGLKRPHHSPKISSIRPSSASVNWCRMPARIKRIAPLKISIPSSNLTLSDNSRPIRSAAPARLHPPRPFPGIKSRFSPLPHVSFLRGENRPEVPHLREIGFRGHRVLPLPHAERAC